MFKTIVIGAKGFVGSHLLQAYHSCGLKAIGTDYRFGSEYCIDLNAPALDKLSLDTHYEYGIIATAKVNPIVCEREAEVSRRLNVDGTLELAKQLHEKGILPILFSSDYVFDGIRGGYAEDDELSPLNEYGRQKADLEKGIRTVCGDNFLLIRLSKVYSFDQGNWLPDIISALAQQQVVRAAVDQVFCPIGIQNVVQAILQLQKIGAKGVFNVCGPQAISRWELVQTIATAMGASPKLVLPISLEDLNDGVKRPKNTSMVCKKLCKLTNIQLASLQEVLTRQANR